MGREKHRKSLVQNIVSTTVLLRAQIRLDPEIFPLLQLFHDHMHDVCRRLGRVWGWNWFPEI